MPSNSEKSHNSLFLSTFRGEVLAAAMLRSALPARIGDRLRWEGLKLESGALVAVGDESRYCDLLFTVPLRDRARGPGVVLGRWPDTGLVGALPRLDRGDRRQADPRAARPLRWNANGSVARRACESGLLPCSASIGRGAVWRSLTSGGRSPLGLGRRRVTRR